MKWNHEWMNEWRNHQLSKLLKNYLIWLGDQGKLCAVQVVFGELKKELFFIFYFIFFIFHFCVGERKYGVCYFTEIIVEFSLKK